MEFEPYIMATGENAGNGYLAAICIPISHVMPLLKTDREGENFMVRAVGISTGAQCDYLVTPDRKTYRISELNATSPEEFWLKLSASGLIYGEDEKKPLFTDAEKECSRLQTKVAKLEKKVEKYRNMISGLFSQSEKL